MTAVVFEMTAVEFEMTVVEFEMRELGFEMTAVGFEMTAVGAEEKPTQPIYVIPTEQSDEGSQMVRSTPLNALKKTHRSKPITAKLNVLDD
jgi:hypothetical protein